MASRAAVAQRLDGGSLARASTTRYVAAAVILCILCGSLSATITALWLGLVQGYGPQAAWRAQAGGDAASGSHGPIVLQSEQINVQAQSHATSVSMPAQFAHLDVNQPLAAGVAPESLASLYPGQSLQSTDVLQFHWVVSSCDRHQWGRMLTHALLSGLFNGLKPTTISIVWCRPLPRDNLTEVPSLLYNLRHSHSINIFFMNEALRGSNQVSIYEASLMTALMVPKALGMPHLPLLMTDDDVVLAPQANLRLSHAMQQIPEANRQAPIFIKCYRAQDIQAAPEHLKDLEQQADDKGDGSKALDVRNMTLIKDITYGAQANFFTSSMTALILYEMLEYIKPNATHQSYLQDIVLMALLTDKHKCNEPGSSCWYYTLQPSLVQHIGTSSTIFNSDKKLNSRFHFDKNFPERISMPGYDAEGTWRRRQQLKRRSRFLLL